jgi:positive regulator of sigma E activity
MGRFVYIIALVFLIIWLVGFFFYSIGAAIHIFLLIAFLIIIARIYMRRSFSRNHPGRDTYKRTK